MAISQEQKQVHTWGWGDFGRLGHGDLLDRMIPEPVSALSGLSVAHVACGDNHSILVLIDGALLCFGRNQNGQLGLGDTKDRASPARVEALSGIHILRAAGGAEHTAVATDDGAMYTFGWGRYGNLGHGHCEDVHTPKLVEGLRGQNVKEPVCGWRHSAALTDTGRLWTFGWSKYGQLGHGDNIDHWKPRLLAELQGGPVVQAAGGWRHMCAVTASGALYGWGWNQFGQLGTDSTQDSNCPRKVMFPNGISIVQVACGWRHTIAISCDGGIFTWGRCANGQLGHGNTAPELAPKRVVKLDLVRAGDNVADGISVADTMLTIGSLSTYQDANDDDAIHTRKRSRLLEQHELMAVPTDVTRNSTRKDLQVPDTA